jgi:hypothetical protein
MAKIGGERGPQEKGYFVKPTVYTASKMICGLPKKKFLAL